jgi:ribonuclease G
MQITRQRMKPEVTINTQEVCPTCNGTGKISSALILEDEIEKNLSYLLNHQHKDLILAVHPIMHAYLTKGFLSIGSRRWKWRWKYKQRVRIRANTNYHLTEFHFFDKQEDEIKL